MSTKLSDSEQYLWNYIERNIIEIPNYSIAELSVEATVSTATIVRTLKKKGYSGYADFKYKLKERRKLHEDFSQFDQEDEGIRLVITKNEQEVMRTISMINIQKLEEAIRIITASRRLILFARGFSEMVAQEMMIKFQLTEKYCELFTDPEIIKIMSKKLSPEDAVLFISLNGETPELVNAAQNCQQHNIATLLLTTAGESTLTSLSDVALVGFKSDGSFFPDYEVRSRLPLTILSRILLDSYALRKKEI